MRFSSFAIFLLAGCLLILPAPVAGQGMSSVHDRMPPKAAFNPPDESTLPEGPMGEAIDHGFSLIMETQKFARTMWATG
ncbi:MAG: hypothetical protein HY579_03990 [Nitrospinae bacterium]|nr:hypothetical protein [Nitrospinota bacterium]